MGAAGMLAGALATTDTAGATATFLAAVTVALGVTLTTLLALGVTPADDIITPGRRLVNHLKPSRSFSDAGSGV